MAAPGQATCQTRPMRSIVVVAVLTDLMTVAVPANGQETPPGGTFFDDDGNDHEAPSKPWPSPVQPAAVGSRTSSVPRRPSLAARWRRSWSELGRRSRPGGREIHCCVEYQTEPTRFQTAVARALIASPMWTSSSAIAPMSSSRSRRSTANTSRTAWATSYRHRGCVLRPRTGSS